MGLHGTFLQRSFFNVALLFFACCSAAFGQNDIRTADKPILQCNFCSAAFRNLQRNFRFRLCCDVVGLVQESKRHLPRKLRKKSEKGFPGPLGRGVEEAQKKSKKVEKGPKTRKKLENLSFSTLFRGFSTPGPRGPGNPFSDFFRSFLGRGLF